MAEVLRLYPNAARASPRLLAVSKSKLPKNQSSDQPKPNPNSLNQNPNYHTLNLNPLKNKINSTKFTLINHFSVLKK